MALQDFLALNRRSVEPDHEIKRFEGHPRISGSVNPLRDLLANRYRGFVHADVVRSLTLIGAPGAHHTPTACIGILLVKNGEAQGGTTLCIIGYEFALCVQYVTTPYDSSY